MAAKKQERKESAGGELGPELEAIGRKLARDPRVSSGKMLRSHGLKVDGKVFAMLVEGALVVKLPKTRVDALIAAKEARPFVGSGGRVMKEWATIALPASRWEPIVREALGFVGG